MIIIATCELYEHRSCFQYVAMAQFGIVDGLVHGGGDCWTCNRNGFPTMEDGPGTAAESDSPPPTMSHYPKIVASANVVPDASNFELFGNDENPTETFSGAAITIKMALWSVARHKPSPYRCCVQLIRRCIKWPFGLWL